MFGIDNTFGVAGASTRACSTPYAATLPEGADEYALPGRRRPRPDPGRHRQRLRQRRRHLVRRPGHPRAARRSTTWSKPAYRDLFVTPGATTSSPGLAFLLATDRGVRRRRLAGLLDPADGQRRQAHPGLVGRLRGRLHPGRRRRRPADRALLRLLAGVHRRRRRAAPRRARCSTPASARSSTPACWPARDNPEGAEALVDFMLSRPFQEALPDAMYVFPVDAGARRCRADWAEFAEQPDDAVHRRPGRDRRAPRRVAAASGATSPAGDRRMKTRRYVTLAGLALGPVLVLAVFFVLPVSGMVARGFDDGPTGRVLEVLGRDRTHRVLWFTVWSAGLATLRRALPGAARGVRPAPAGLPRPRPGPRAAAGAVRAADRGGRRGVPAAGARHACSTAARSRSSRGWCSSTSPS